jgi:hypothetical protein
MHSKLLEIVRGMKTSPGTSIESLDDLMTRLGRQLPSDYLMLMQFTNGAEGPIGSSYVVIWPIEEVIPLNEGNGVAEFAPSLMLFGSDGGSKGYGFDTAAAGLPIVSVDLILTDVVEQLGSDLLEFFENIAAAG